jgi:hypothetical protein
MLLLQKDTLIENEFADNVKLLQDYPETDLAVLLERSYLLCFEECQMAGGMCCGRVFSQLSCGSYPFGFVACRLNRGALGSKACLCYCRRFTADRRD